MLKGQNLCWVIYGHFTYILEASLVVQMVKHLPAMGET